GASDAYDLRHVRALTLDLPYEEAFDACISAARTLGTRTRLHRNLDDGTIEARTIPDWRTSGERASFAVQPTSLGRVRIEVTTRPAAGLALLDYGASLANVERIVEYLRDHPRWPAAYR